MKKIIEYIKNLFIRKDIVIKDCTISGNVMAEGKNVKITNSTVEGDIIGNKIFK